MVVQSTFVSYSGRLADDKAFARQLLVRLEEHGLEPWIYERRGGEVPAGAGIDEYCRTKIRKADLFVVLISDSSLESPYTQAEVTYAITTHGVEGVFQIATSRRAIADWGEPYLTLSAYKHVRANATSAADIERCIEDICCRVGVTYQPPQTGSARLPLLARLTAELREARPGDPQYEVGLFSVLRKIALKAAGAYTEGRLEHALSALDTLLYHLDDEFDGKAFYYPMLVRGVLQAEIGRQRPPYLDSAFNTFHTLLTDPRFHEKIDENAAAGLAAVEMLRGNAAEALRLYREANALVTERGEVDPDLVHNLLIATIALEAPISNEDATALTHWMGDAFLTKDPDLVERLTALYALTCAYRGEAAAAERAFVALGQSSLRVADLLFRMAQELGTISKSGAGKSAELLAEALFLRAIEPLSHPTGTTRVCYAAFLYERARFDDALAVLQPALQEVSQSPRLLVDAAWCHFQLGETERAVALCQRAAQLSLPNSTQALTQAEMREFLYFRGFAHWLIGEADIAAKDFEDSGYARAQWYFTVSSNHTVTGFVDSPLVRMLRRANPLTRRQKKHEALPGSALPGAFWIE